MGVEQDVYFVAVEGSRKKNIAGKNALLGRKYNKRSSVKTPA